MSDITVLVVDDLPVILGLYQDSFRIFFDWSVLQADGVQAASRVLETEIQRIQAVVCDYQMGGPGKNGPDLFRLWAEKLAARNIPFFLVTGGGGGDLPAGMIVVEKSIAMKEIGLLIQAEIVRGSHSTKLTT